jgi:hypothetical protein
MRTAHAFLWLIAGVLTVSAPANAAPYGGGSGTLEDPYQIWTAEQMNTIGLHSEDWNKSFILMADIDLSAFTGTQYNRIGDYYGVLFSGIFDGNGHVIINLNYMTESTVVDSYNRMVGLFGATGTDSIIKNLGLENIQLSSGDYVGGIVGNNSGKIISCYSIGIINSLHGHSGGLVGWNDGTIINCYSAGEVAGSGTFGGLVGTNYSGKIENSISSSIISGTGSSSIGGLVGGNMGLLISCYSTGSVSGSDVVGGLCGTNTFGTDFDKDSGVIIDCYATGNVTGAGGYIGGLVGIGIGCKITSCFATGTVTGTDGSTVPYVGGLVGVNGTSIQDTAVITSCYATGAVSGTYSVGVLVGWNNGVINSCYTIGAVSGTGSGVIGVGGLVGNNAGTITFCYATSSVSGTDSYIGGLIGVNGGTINGSFWDIQTSGQTTSAGGTGKTTAEMKTLSTFTDAAWDFATVWMMCDGKDCPHLQWEGIECTGYEGGSGTWEDPFRIRTAEQLQVLSLTPEHWDRHFVLVADIDLAGLPNLQIGHYAEEGDPNRKPFTGWFQCGYGGSVFTISNYRFHTDGALTGVGLFGYLVNGFISDMTLEGMDIDAPNSSYVGGIVGINEGGAIVVCHAHGRIVGLDGVGGLVGFNWRGYLPWCRFKGEVRGSQYVGGLAGYNYDSVRIEDSYFQGTAAGTSAVGGIAGGSEELSRINRCYSTGLIRGGVFAGGITGGSYNSSIEDSGSLCDVIGDAFLGGLAGVSDYGASVSRSYSAGVVSGSHQPSGGLIGQGNRNAKDSFWDIQTTTQAASAGGTGKTTAQMRSYATFIDAGWDFEDEVANGDKNIWMIRGEISYPRLTTLYTSGADFVGDYGVGQEEFAVLADHWLVAHCLPHPYDGYCGGADMNRDGQVDLVDLLILADHWMEGQ